MKLQEVANVKIAKTSCSTFVFLCFYLLRLEKIKCKNNILSRNIHGSTAKQIIFSGNKSTISIVKYLQHPSEKKGLFST